MKLSKIISSLLFVSVLMMFTGGCGDNGRKEQVPDQKITLEFRGLTVLEADFNSDSGNHACEYSPWNRESIQKEVQKSISKAPKRITVEFNGKEYTGDFANAIKIIPFSQVTYCYFRDNFHFETDASTNELTKFEILKSTTSGKMVSESKCLEIANEFANKYINLSEYKCVSEINTVLNICQISYTREIGSVEAHDALYINVDSYGDIVYFHAKTLQAFDNVKKIIIDENSITTAIDEKISEMYKGVSDYEKYLIVSSYATRLEDGGYGLVYNIEVKFKAINTGDGSCSVRINPITLLITD